MTENSFRSTLDEFAQFVANVDGNIKVEIVRNNQGDGIAAGWHVSVLRKLDTYPSCLEGIHFGTLRRHGIDKTARFTDVCGISLYIPDNPSHVEGFRHRFTFSWSRRQWVEEDHFQEVLGRLLAAISRADQKNIENGDKLRNHPLNIRAGEQINREKQVLDSIPSEEADAYIVKTSGRTLEQIAAMSRSTRGRLRREARQEISKARAQA